MKAELLSHYGNDLTICNVARVSYGKQSDEFTDKDIKLINYLAKHGHTSPFRHTNIQFRINCPIYVERQLFKHQVGWVANSISGRYVDFSDTYTMVTEWRKQSANSKQGSDGPIEEQLAASEIEAGIIGYCKTAYNRLIELGVSKEQARTILPLNLNTTFIWTGSFQAFVHLCNLRLKPDAQQETREVVAEMLQCVKNIEGNPFQHSLNAFNL